MTTLLDNKAQGKVGDAITQNIQADARLAIASSFFSIYGYSILSKQLKEVQSLRLLLPLNGISNETPFCIKGLADIDAERSFRNNLDLAKVARECAQWIEKKAEVRGISLPVAQNLIHIENLDEESIAISGSSPFTATGLGALPSNGYEMNTLFSSPSETSNMLKWFDSIWDNPEATKDVKALVLSQLEELFTSKSPERLYYLTLYNIFFEFLSEFEEDKIIKTRTGIKETVVWNKLYRFQRDGVLGAIDKIEKYNGCIIADSVGLGKTFEALAVIKYYELRNDRVLVLCPKKLRENWTIFTVNDKRNLVASDRFNYDVLNHTDLSRTRGKSGEINLETLNWGNYDLIVIDESHNFRNNNASRNDGITRYARLMRDIIRSGVKTKVLMLSATPVNSRMNDLKNQVAFITEGSDDALDNLGIPSIQQTLRNAQMRFNKWLKLEVSERTTKSLLEALNFDYFKLLDLLTIARSRKHIEKYYDITEIGQFPERAKPINIKADIDTENAFPPLSEINRDIRRLNLSAYTPLKYVLPDRMDEYSRKYDMQVSDGSVFRQIDREQSLIHLMRVNLFKRMESSINSFAMTIDKLLCHVREIIDRIEVHEEVDVDELNIEDIEIDSEEFAPFLIGNKVKVLIHDMDRIRWKQELKEDEAQLSRLLDAAVKVDWMRDEKLDRLKTLVAEKVRNPINPGVRKVLVFTAFADTANYLYKHISEWASRELNIHSALVTGSGTNQTTMPGIRKDLSAILTSFSPLSKERYKIDETLTEEIDLIITTDCISEGQNLQDCDYLINYDIHWNPVRIIQRFGRIDRLGSTNKTIQLVNFWPNMELDEYINLEARVSGRMVLLDISATGEENVIEFNDAGKMNDLEYRRRQLEQLQEEVVDMEDLSNSISITDLTLNDVRMDLARYLEDHAENLETIAPGAFSVTTTRDIEEISPGAIFCLKCTTDNIQFNSAYSLAPYYLIYVSDSGEVLLNFIHAKKVLDILKLLGRGESELNAGAVAQFNAMTKNSSDMTHYQKLLSKAIAAITGKDEEQGVESLFQRGGTTISKQSFQSIDDFEVLAYLVILEESIP